MIDSLKYPAGPYGSILLYSLLIFLYLSYFFIW